MSPEQAGAAAAIARLRSEMTDDRSAMARRRRDLEEARRRLEIDADDPAAIAFEAWALHGWYGALESLLERVARQLDMEVPSGDRWHRALLAQVTAEVPGVRPGVLPRQLRGDLEELLAIRHFLRHAYGTDLDPRRLRVQSDSLSAIAPEIDLALDAFDAFLRAAGAAATK